MPINQIVTPLDSAILENKQQYVVYFKIVQHAFKELLDALVKHELCNTFESSFFKQYGELLLYSLEAFRVKYLYDDEERMKIDLTESGLPNYLEFRYLINDLDLKQEHIQKLPKPENLKEAFLESLLKYKEPVPKRKLEQAASIVYYSSVEKNYIFRRFVQGKIITIKNNPEAPYLVSWAFYDVSLNRPFICFLYFDLHKTSVDDYTESIYEVLEKVADRNMSLDMMAYALDKRLPKLLPKKLRKFDVGPIYNVFAKDDLKITHAILEGIISKTLTLAAHAISLEIDEIYSKGSFKEGSIFKKQEFQIWEPEKQERFLFAPHRVLQVLHDTIPERLNKLTQEPIEIATLTV